MQEHGDMEMAGTTRRLAEFALGLDYASIPPGVIARTKEQLMSILAATLAGADTDPGRKALTAVRAWGDRPEAVAFGADYRTSMRSAAFVNSINAQLLEFEDALMPYAHIGAASVPTALAVAEVLGRNGRQLLEALVVGNEIGGRIGHAIHRGIRMGNAIPVYQVVVPFVASRLMGYGLVETLDAVGGALIQTQLSILSGWVSYSKAYLSAMPTLAGVTAATLAGQGFTGYHEVLEDPLGYLTQTCERPVPEEAVEGLGEVWQTEKLVSKAFPVCGWTLAPVEATVELVKGHGLKAEEIEEIRVRVPVQSAMGGTMWKADHVMRKIRERHDWSYIPLLFEITYPIAAAAVDGELTPRQWRDDRIFAPAIHEMMRRVRFVTDLALTDAYLTQDRLGAAVTIRTRDGRELEQKVPAPRGSQENPIDGEEKFHLCADPVIGEKRASRAVALIDRIEEVAHIGELTACGLKAS